MRDLIYLDTYILQQDVKIGLPKGIVKNLSIKKDLDSKNSHIILKIKNYEVQTCE